MLCVIRKASGLSYPNIAYWEASNVIFDVECSPFNLNLAMPGTPELAVIFLLVLLLFGPDKLPELARLLARATREIRKVSTEFRRHINLDE